MQATFASVTGLTKSYGRRPALQDVSFQIHANEILGLIGPNGAGKTTLMECIAGLLPADAGAFNFDRSNLFYLPDAITPWADQTVRWALEFSIKFFGGRADLLQEVIADLHLQSLLHAPIRTLSKGQRKRAMLAIGLLTPQPLLMIDEPFEGLDLRQSRELQSVLRKHVAGSRTIFLSIHQINEAALICDRFVLLDNGRIVATGTLPELRERAYSADRNAHELEEIFLALT